MGAERMLAEVLEPLKSRYDYILIDTCPSLGMLTINALAAADEVIITVNPQLLAMMGLQDFLRIVGKIKKRINPKLEVAGILLTMCESRTTLCKVLTEEVTGSFQGKIKVFDTRIPATVKVGESIYYNMPIAQYSKKAYPVYMNDEEAKLYADMEEDLFIPLKKGEITAANAAALSGKLLQMANGAVYSDDGDEIVIHDQKLDALEDMIEAANGRSVMVAYWFKHDLSRIMRRLTEKKIPFEKLDSEESIRKWNRGELPVALIHPASAGHGLNLQSGGNTLIWFGLTWSLELYQQTVARLWRQGQTAETVVVQHIITAGTIDEDIMKALASKDMTQNRLIAAVKARVTHGR